MDNIDHVSSIAAALLLVSNSAANGALSAAGTDRGFDPSTTTSVPIRPASIMSCVTSTAARLARTSSFWSGMVVHFSCLGRRSAARQAKKTPPARCWRLARHLPFAWRLGSQPSTPKLSTLEAKVAGPHARLISRMGFALSAMVACGGLTQRDCAGGRQPGESKRQPLLLNLCPKNCAFRPENNALLRGH